jgi:hypothetical protein
MVGCNTVPGGSPCKHDFAIHHIGILLPKQILQDWDLGQSRNTGQSLHILLLQHPAKQTHLAILQPNFVLHFPLTDHRFGDPANRLIVDHRRYVEGNLESDISVGMDMWRDINIHPDIDVLKLSIDQSAY